MKLNYYIPDGKYCHKDWKNDVCSFIYLKKARPHCSIFNKKLKFNDIAAIKIVSCYNVTK
jgi:hypothetical protein